MKEIEPIDPGYELRDHHSKADEPTKIIGTLAITRYVNPREYEVFIVLAFSATLRRRMVCTSGNPTGRTHTHSREPEISIRLLNRHEPFSLQTGLFSFCHDKAGSVRRSPSSLPPTRALKIYSSYWDMTSTVYYWGLNEGAYRKLSFWSWISLGLPFWMSSIKGFTLQGCASALSFWHV